MIDPGDQIASVQSAINEALAAGEVQKKIALLKTKILNPRRELLKKTKSEVNQAPSQPPSTGRVWPFTKFEASEARNIAGPK